MKLYRFFIFIFLIITHISALPISGWIDDKEVQSIFIQGRISEIGVVMGRDGPIPFFDLHRDPSERWLVMDSAVSEFDWEMGDMITIDYNLKGEFHNAINRNKKSYVYVTRRSK